MTEQVHPIELELMKATGIRPPENRKSDTLEKWREMLLETIDKKVSDDEFDLLSDEAQEWVNQSVDAVLSGEATPTFSEIELEEDEGEENVEPDDKDFSDQSDMESDEEESDDDSDSEEDDEDEGSEEDDEDEGSEEDDDSEESQEEDDEASGSEAVSEEEMEEEGELEEEEKSVREEAEEEETKEAAAAVASPKMKKTKKSAYRSKSKKFDGDALPLAVPRNKGAGYRVKELLLYYGLGQYDEILINQLRKEHLRMSASTLTAIRYEMKQVLTMLHEHGLLDKKKFDEVYGKGKEPGND